MRWIKAAVIAISTYSRIPVPQIKWDDRAMKSAIAFLPLVGAVLGALIFAWQRLCEHFEIGAVLFGAVATGLTVWVTGGIHMDGYCDTSDALASWQDRERRLEILKDPHVGAFALIRCVIYVLIYFALFCELYTRGRCAGIAFVFPVSRCLSAWNALTLPNARKNGMLAQFTENADRTAVCAALAVFTALSVAGLLFSAFTGGIAVLALCAAVMIWYRAKAMKYFGGVTGDTSGFYLQITELFSLAGLLIGGILTQW